MEKPAFDIESIFPYVDDNECKILSFIALGGNERKIDKYSLRALECKGLLKKNDDGKHVLANKVDKVISTYPLFGKQGKKTPYNKAFITMLLSIVANGYLSAKKQIWVRYIESGFFKAIFPSMENASKAAIYAIDSLIKLKVIKQGQLRLTLNKEKSIEFYSLKEEIRLSYIINPDASDDEIIKMSKAINLAFRLCDIPMDDKDKYFGMIFDITGFDLAPYLDLLLDFDILANNANGFICAREMIESEDDGVISSDFVYSSSSDTSTPIFFFLSPLKADRKNQWAIDKSSMKSAFSFGYTNEDVKCFLKDLSTLPIPESINQRIDGWYESFCSLRAMRALVLVADEKNARVIENLPLLKVHILMHPAENVFLMNPDTEYAWRNILSYSGFDMLGDTEGACFMPREKEGNTFISQVDFPPDLPAMREIAYDRTKVETEMECAHNLIERRLVASGIALSDCSSLGIEKIEGLFFQEKMRAIEKAINDDALLYIQFADNREKIVKPLSISKKEDCSILNAKDGKIVLDKIWKVAVLPLFAKEE